MAWFRFALVLLVVAWLLDLLRLRTFVPIWLPFVVALALELELFVLGLRAGAVDRSRGRLPQEVDRKELGYGGEADLLLVRDDEGDVWVPYAGEEDEELEALIERERARPPAGIVRRPREPLGRLFSGLALIAALAALVWVVERPRGWEALDSTSKASATERFSQEASRIVGREVVIRCDESGGFVGAVQHADGVAEVGGRVAYLAPDRCLDLQRLAFEGEVRDSQTGRSLAVLAHEAWHLRGERDEGRTECFALQSGVALGRRLGLSEGTARRLMRQQLVENDLRGGTTEEYRVPPECRDGGALDRDPESSRFP